MKSDVRIKQKFVIEVVVLSIILATVSFMAINNTTHIEKNFTDLNDELIPTLSLLKDMRLVTSNILTSTLEFAIFEIESPDFKAVQSMDQDWSKIDEEINLSKTQFNELFSLYRQHLSTEEDFLAASKIEQQWKKFEIFSDKFREYKKRGIASEEFVKMKEEFKDAKNSLFKEIDSVIITNEEKVQEKRRVVSELVEKTTLVVSLTLIIFIFTMVFMRYSILKSILIPILKIRRATRKIAGGDFEIRIKDVHKDEIGELADDINQMAQDLETAQEKLLKTEKLSIIGTLAARMAHDLRNPLTIIMGGMEYLKMRNTYQEKDISTFDTIHRAIERISHQIQEVLDFVKMSPLQLEMVSLLTLIKQIISNMKLQDTIKIDLPENDMVIECDYRKIEVAFINILRNAFDAIGTSGHVKIRLFDLNDRVKIEIEDSGPGIASDIRTKVFEPLFTTKQRGTGLGLTSVKNIVEEHGGQITFSNNPTTFSIVLPKIRNRK